MMFSRVKAGQEVSQGESVKEGKGGKDEDQEELEEVEDRDDIVKKEEGQEVVDDQGVDLGNEVKNGGDSEMKGVGGSTYIDNIQGELNLEMFRSDIMGKNNIKTTLDSGDAQSQIVQQVQVRENDQYEEVGVVDTSVKGVNQLIQQMKIDHTKP